MKASMDEILETSGRVLDVIRQPSLTPGERDWVVQETLANFRDYYNPGFLEYRKSVSTNYTSVEWKDGGTTFTDISGKEYIDFLGGFGIYNAGHRHPKVVAAVVNQLQKQALHSQEILDPLRGFLAKLVAKVTPGDLQYSFFTNSGTESVEGALKLARLNTGRQTIISTTRAFHGKSLGALSATAKGWFRRPYLPLMPGFRHVPFGDAATLEKVVASCALVGEEVAAVILEPIQGEGGVNVPPDDYLSQVREICDRYGVLLILDEVQTGMGRTGKMFASEHFGVIPDIMCLGKAFGGGVLPIGAFVASKKVYEKMFPDPFLHTSTFGGNPVACAAAIAAIHVTLEERLPERAAEMGDYFLRRLKELVDRHRGACLEARGKGLLLGIEFVNDEVGYEFAKGLFDRGVLVAGTLINSKTIRVEPPLTIRKDEIDRGLGVMEEVLARIPAPAAF